MRKYGLGMEDLTENHGACPLGQASCPIEAKLNALLAEIERLKEQVGTDPLTGLFNVRHLRHVLAQEMERTHRTNLSTAFILLDVDYFKQFNDSHGHIVGDKVLQHLAELIKTTVRRIDIPCRYGGEEFGIILPSTPVLIAAQVAERLRSRVASTPLIYENKELFITISAGIEVYSKGHGDTMDAFIDRTDQQLYRAKNQGRNQVCYASDKLIDRAAVSQDEKDELFQQLSDEE